MERTMSGLWRAWWCVCAVLLVCSATAVAQELRVSARMSSGVIKLGSDARLIIEVRDAQAAGLGDLPKVEGLTIGPAGSPAIARTTEISNGRSKTSVQLTWSLPVVATQTGRFTIPSLEVRADGKATFTKPVQFEVVKDVEGEDFGWFTMDAPREVHAGQPFTLDLVVGFDKSLVANVNYANLTLPWYGALSGLIELPTPDAGQRASNQINLNGDQVISVENGGERERDGRTYTTLRWRKRYLASDPGVLELSTSHFEFGQIARSFFGLDPSQKKTMYKRLEPVSIRVLSVPEAARPIDWSGAVGRVEARAAADRRVVDAGDSIKLTVDWSGDANLDFFEPPDLARLKGFERFRVYGRTDRKSAERRTVVYDLAPVDPELKEIPAVPLSVFDVDRRSYQTIETRPIPIQVRALKNAAALAEVEVQREFASDIGDIVSTPRESSDPWAPSALALFLGMGVVLAAGGRVRRAVYGADDPWAPVVRKRRRALAELRRSAQAAPDADASYRALCTYLAARTNETETAWRGRDVRAWVIEQRQADRAAPAAEVEAELTQVLRECEQAAWARAGRYDAARIVRLAERLQAEGV